MGAKLKDRTAQSSPLILGPRTSAPGLSFSLHLECLSALSALPVCCPLIDFSPGCTHPSRPSSYLTCVKRLPFELVGRKSFCFFLPRMPRTGSLQMRVFCFAQNLSYCGFCAVSRNLASSRAERWQQGDNTGIISY